MKKIIISLAIFVSVNSLAFGARISGMDLVNIFEDNQFGAGYNTGQFKTSLYSDFGTESLRFSVNILEVGGSLFNNSDKVYDTSKFYDNTSGGVPRTGETFLRGLPRFFVAAGYDFGGVRFAIGYGGKLMRSNDVSRYDYKGIYDQYGPDPNQVDPGPSFNGNKYAATVGNAWYGSDVSLFFESTLNDDSKIRVALPIQFGFGMGRDYVIADIYGSVFSTTIVGDEVLGFNRGNYAVRYDAKNNIALSVAPQVEWVGMLGYLTGLRLTVPFAMYSRKGGELTGDELLEEIKFVHGSPGNTIAQNNIRNYLTAKIEDMSRTIIGAKFEATIGSITEDDLADFRFSPSFTFMKALSGNDINTSTIVGKQSDRNDVDISLDDLIDAGYTFDSPLGLKLSLPFGVFIDKFLISISATPRLDLYFIDSVLTLYQEQGSASVKQRVEPFYGIGYALPIELSIRPLGNLSFNIGMLAEGRALVGMPSTLNAEIDGSIVWYF